MKHSLKRATNLKNGSNFGDYHPADPFGARDPIFRGELLGIPARLLKEFIQ